MVQYILYHHQTSNIKDQRTKKITVWYYDIIIDQRSKNIRRNMLENVLLWAIFWPGGSRCGSPLIPVRGIACLRGVLASESYYYCLEADSSWWSQSEGEPVQSCIFGSWAKRLWRNSSAVAPLLLLTHASVNVYEVRVGVVSCPVFFAMPGSCRLQTH